MDPKMYRHYVPDQLCHVDELRIFPTLTGAARPIADSLAAMHRSRPAGIRIATHATQVRADVDFWSAVNTVNRSPRPSSNTGSSGSYHESDPAR